MSEGIVIKGLKKKFRDFDLGPIDASIPMGNITAIIGANSSGKSALLRCISRSCRIDAGSVSFAKAECSGNIGMVMDRCPYPPGMDPMDLSEIMSKVFPDWDRSGFLRLCSHLEIDSEKIIADMSEGSRTKLQIAVSLSHRTDYLLMDEPTSGLDSGSRDKVLDLVREYVSDEGRTVVIASHDTSFIDVNADCILLLDNGRQVLFDDMNSVRDEYGVVEESPGSVPQSYIFGEETGPYSRAVFVRNRAELSRRLPELTVESIRLCDLVAHCRGLGD